MVEFCNLLLGIVSVVGECLCNGDVCNYGSLIFDFNDGDDDVVVFFVRKVIFECI